MRLLKPAPLFKVFLLSLTLSLFGCGGSSGGGGEPEDNTTTFSGNTAPAEIDADNAEEIGQAAGESVDKASASSGLPSSPVGAQVSGPMGIDELNDIVLQTGQQLAMPSGAEVEGVCSSGSASTSGVTTNRIDINYNNCVLIDSSATIDGSAVIEFNDVNDPNAGFTITYNNFTVTDPESGTQTIDAVIVCSGTGTCTFNSDFVGADGVKHRVRMSQTNPITGDGTDASPFNGEATFFHGTHGSVSIDVNGVTYGSCEPLPDGGSIIFTGSNGASGTINFDESCTVTGTFTDGSGGSSVSF
jgi:hypothetical protein